MSITDDVAEAVVGKALVQVRETLLGAVGISVGLGIVNTLLLSALLIVVIVK